MEKKIVFAERDRIEALVPYVKKVVKAIGVEGAWVSDRSIVADFRGVWEDEMTNTEACEEISRKLGFVVHPHDYIFEVAERLKASEASKREARQLVAGAVGIVVGVLAMIVLYYWFIK